MIRKKFRRWLQARERNLIASSSETIAFVWVGCVTLFFVLRIFEMWSSGKWLFPLPADDLVGFLGVSGALVLAAGVTWLAIRRAIDDWRKSGQKT